MAPTLARRGPGRGLSMLIARIGHPAWLRQHSSITRSTRSAGAGPATDARIDHVPWRRDRRVRRDRPGSRRLRAARRGVRKPDVPAPRSLHPSPLRRPPRRWHSRSVPVAGAPTRRGPPSSRPDRAPDSKDFEELDQVAEIVVAQLLGRASLPHVLPHRLHGLDDAAAPAAGQRFVSSNALRPSYPTQVPSPLRTRRPPPS
jgi:hypothetical protein